MPRRHASNHQVKESPKRWRNPLDKQDEVEWGGFINVKLTSDEKEAYTQWLDGDGASFWAMLVDGISTGLKFGLSWDGENDCFVATYSGCGVVDDDRRYCLTARGATMESATALLVFKDVIMLEQDWGRYKPSSGMAEVG